MNNEIIKNEVNNDANKTMASNEEMAKKKSDKGDLSDLNKNKNNSDNNNNNNGNNNSNNSYDINNNGNNNKDAYSKQFGKKPITVECLYCHEKITSKVHKEFHWGSFCFNFWTLCLPNLLCKTKEGPLYIRHFCPLCGQVLSEDYYLC